MGEFPALYDSALSSRYLAGRRLSAESADTWTTILRPFLGMRRTPTVLDLGCGTGRFSTLISNRFGANVIGIEPSTAMLTHAPRDAGVGRICYVAGRAEHLPLANASCDAAWISQVIHHLRDRTASATELRRILRPGGSVLIRGTFGDRLDGYPALFKFFPGSRRLTARFPTTVEIKGIFFNQGFSLVSDRRIRQTTCHSLREFAERIRLRADSTLVQLPDRDFEAGLKALEEAADGEPTPSPVVETIDLLVFRRP